MTSVPKTVTFEPCLAADANVTFGQPCSPLQMAVEGGCEPLELLANVLPDGFQ